LCNKRDAKLLKTKMVYSKRKYPYFLEVVLLVIKLETHYFINRTFEAPFISQWKRKCQREISLKAIWEQI